MKKLIIGLDKDWLAFVSGVIGVLLIIFPKNFVILVPWLLGITLLLRAVTSVIILLKYKDQKINAGSIVIYAVLGMVILVHNAESIGVIGSVWAMISLKEVSDEITQSYCEKHFSVFRLVVAAVSVGLAVMLLFNPFEHFEFHVRVLGLEMLSSVFVRRHNIIQNNRQQDVEAELKQKS